MKLTKRKGFNFFRSYYDVYNELETNQQKVDFMDALFDRQFQGIKPLDLKGLSKFAYISQVNSIDTQVKGYEDKLMSLNKDVPNYDPWHGVNEKLLTPTAQEKVQEEVQGKEKEKVKEEGKGKIEERKLKFSSTLEPYESIYGRPLLKEFNLYWTEPNKSNTKFRQELEKTWSLERRLSTWAKNDKNFNPLKNGNQQPPIDATERNRRDSEATTKRILAKLRPDSEPNGSAQEPEGFDGVQVEPSEDL